jgi:hypothetical protein
MSEASGFTDTYEKRDRGSLLTAIFTGDKQMNSELLTLRRMTVGIIYQPLGLQPVDVNRIYASITEHYPYGSLQHLPDGARMSNPENDCFIQQNRVQINETVMHFQAAKEKCMDMFEIIQSHLHIQHFLSFGVKLTGFMQMNEAPMAAQFLENKMLPELTSKIGLLGDGRQGVGLRIVLHRDGIHEIKIEPFFADLSQLFVELDVQRPTPFGDLSLVETWMDGAYNYMFGELKEFLGSFA